MKEMVAKVVLVLATLLAVSLAIYYVLEPAPCGSLSCFQERMTECRHSTFINEEPEASWRYTILRKQNTDCKLEVTLLQAKEGDLQLRKFEGDSMTCIYPLGFVAYPDKDMSHCTGLLKEDLQGLIIEKLHNYLLENLADVKGALDLLNVTGNQSAQLAA